MKRIYYVVGYADTRQEFYPEGVTASKNKAEKFKRSLTSKLCPNARQWATIREVSGI